MKIHGFEELKSKTSDPDQTRIVLHIPGRLRNGRPRRLSGTTRVDAKAEMILRDICDATGLPMSYVASELIVQAASVCEFCVGGETV